VCLHFLLFLPALLLASSLDDEVKDFRVDELALHLQATQPGAERDYFAGILANREGHTEESIRLLTAALPGIRESSPTRAAVALEALADDYTKSFPTRTPPEPMTICSPTSPSSCRRSDCKEPKTTRVFCGC